MGLFVETVAQAVHKHRGTIGQCAPGSVTAHWGAVSFVSGAKALAVEAALAIQEALGCCSTGDAGGGALQVCISIGHGRVVACSMGSARTRFFGFLGPPAAWMGAMTHLGTALGAPVLVDAAVCDAEETKYHMRLAAHLWYQHRRLLVYEVRGRRETRFVDEWMYELRDLNRARPEGSCELFAVALQRFTNGALAEGAALFEQCLERVPGDAVARYYLNHCATTTMPSGTCGQVRATHVVAPSIQWQEKDSNTD
ncbi:MAG: hypothetical protein GY842_05515 [bacterium]|nr:hypothetical protein [bacterium]